MRYKKIGEILISEGVISPSQLEETVNIQKREGGKLGEILIRLNYLSEEQLVIALGKQLGIPYVTSSEILKPQTEQNLEELIPYDFAIKNICVLFPEPVGPVRRTKP